ncbi:hypothetical protein [Spirillospora albida]|uniref:hypothetical protein n=1 Tax=Spirillospora albida TaxID=58123 RepID=UPI0004C05F7D|nr:hypothetical protein [Spirillospora albida]
MTISGGDDAVRDSGMSDEDVLAALRRDFPGHRISRGRRRDGALGCWVAALRDPSAGLYPTLIEDTAEKLRDQLVLESGRVRAEPKEPVRWWGL